MNDGELRRKTDDVCIFFCLFLKISNEDQGLFTGKLILQNLIHRGTKRFRTRVETDD